MMKHTFQIAPGYLADDMRVYHRVCQALHAAGYRVSLAAHALNGASALAGAELRSLGDWTLGARGWSLRERWPRCRQAARLALQSEADIYAFYSMEFVPWSPWLRRKTRKPVIFDCMEDYEAYALLMPGVPRLWRRPLSWVVAATLHRVAGRIDAMVFSDAGTARRFEAYARRVLVVHNFPDLKLFTRPAGQNGKAPFDITFHGGFYPHILHACLDIDDALVARQRRLRWRLIGHMPLREWFVRELARRGAEERFSFLDLVPHAQVATEVCQAKLGIVPLPNWPKYQNNLPQKLFEFMALEMPVVLSDLPPSRPFAGDQRCALMVKPDDPGAYAEAIIRLVDDAPLRRAMGQEGRRRVEQRYNWGREAAKLVELYEELLREPAAARERP